MGKIAIVGAGKTGRGFIGRLLREAGKEILFIDRDAELVSALNEAGKFRVNFFGNEREPLEVEGFRACTWEDAPLDEVELIFVSVGGQNLPETGKKLAKCLDGDRHYYLITCENASRPSEALRKAIGKNNISVSEATVFCTTVEGEGLDIYSENYPYLQCNADLLDGYVPEIKQIRPIGQFSNFLTRKLYTYNAASCVIAYLGWAKGYTDYADAANDREILDLLDRNYAATNRALCREFGYEEKDQEEFALLSKKKFCDRTITDTVSRNARDPQRKLAASERIMGPIRLLYKYGEDASVLEKTAAAAILYQAGPDDPWTKIQSEKTRKQILKEICGVDPEESVFGNIMEYIKEIETGYFAGKSGKNG
ncbi:MAG TPA: hypothetical protein DF613_16840 [Lachnospiraceae bacterium]|nr:hypothetical protein [Lachnospiraceae bacterium]